MKCVMVLHTPQRGLEFNRRFLEDWEGGRGRREHATNQSTLSFAELLIAFCFDGRLLRVIKYLSLP